MAKEKKILLINNILYWDDGTKVIPSEDHVSIFNSDGILLEDGIVDSPLTKQGEYIIKQSKIDENDIRLIKVSKVKNVNDSLPFKNELEDISEGHPMWRATMGGVFFNPDAEEPIRVNSREWTKVRQNLFAMIVSDENAGLQTYKTALLLVYDTSKYKVVYNSWVSYYTGDPS